MPSTPSSGARSRPSPPTLPAGEIARLHLEYLLRNQRPDGSLYFSYYPFENVLYQGIDPARLAHTAWTLACASQTEAALTVDGFFRTGDMGELTETGDIRFIGRTTEMIDPNGHTDFYVYNDAAHEVRSYLGWDSATGLVQRSKRTPIARIQCSAALD